ncbi:50S ribosomal protein L2 [Escherichia coli]|uniref:50S ribosomal protein L2 n=1 Tax=Escherichia coli TaxID=562 RepID=A0A377DB30_ECOLX|nr:50S ribosomal protein L2 [Escherichia coli]
MKPGKGGQLARSAGTYVQIVARDGAYVTLRLRSGEMRKVEADCRATLGEVGNAEICCAFWVKQVLHAGVVFVRPFAYPMNR